MIGKVIIVSVLAVLVADLATASTVVDSQAPSEHEMEAYEQVDILLSTCDWPESVHSDSGDSVKRAVGLLRQSLEEMSQYAPEAESSESAQVRGYSVELTKKLLKLHDLINSDNFVSASVPIGLRILDMVKAGKQLAHLEDMLVALVSAHEDGIERQEGSSESGRGFWCRLWHKICD